MHKKRISLAFLASLFATLTHANSTHPVLIDNVYAQFKQGQKVIQLGYAVSTHKG